MGIAYITISLCLARTHSLSLLIIATHEMIAVRVQPPWLRSLSASMLLLSCLCCLAAPSAALTMPQVFGSHMVLQRAPLIARLWGEAAPKSAVVCQLDSEPAITVYADASSRFVCELPPQPLSWNRSLTVSGDSQSLHFTDVAFGDVVLCLGSAQQQPARAAPDVAAASCCSRRPVPVIRQSNMELSLNYTFGGAEAIADSINHPSIRLFTVAWTKAATPQNDTRNRWSGGSWRRSSPEAVDCGLGCGFFYFASTCYYYGLAMDIALQGQVPLGLMQVTYGGTWVEEWTRAAVVPACGAVPHANSTTGQIWNGMVSQRTRHQLCPPLFSLALSSAAADVRLSPLLRVDASRSGLCSTTRLTSRCGIRSAADHPTARMS